MRNCYINLDMRPMQARVIQNKYRLRILRYAQCVILELATARLMPSWFLLDGLNIHSVIKLGLAHVIVIDRESKDGRASTGTIDNALILVIRIDD